MFKPSIGNKATFLHVIASYFATGLILFLFSILSANWKIEKEVALFEYVRENRNNRVKIFQNFGHDGI